jgi:hypothetical protein
MISRWTISLLFTGAVAAIGAFTATVATRPASAPAAATDSATEALLTWLQATDAQRAELRGHDLGFASDLKRLREALAAKRALLAGALDDADASPEAVRARLEEVLAAQAAIERRVTDYLLSVRDHLTSAQRRELFGLCAEEVRQGRGWQWGRQQHGNATSRPAGAGQGQGQGRRGPPPGRGPGGFRGGRGGPGSHD